MIMNTELILLADSYEKSPLIKGLVKLLPAGSSIDSIFSGYFNNLKKKRYKTFFDALQSGAVELTEEIIQTEDFLHAFFCTINYVERTKQDEKIKRFATILKQLGTGNISFSEFEDCTAIFNELSDKEFALLSIKYKYEQRYLPEKGETEYRSNGVKQNPKQVIGLYWEYFKRDVIKDLRIEEKEFNPMLMRVQRTGCYIPLKGYHDEQFEEDGNTTSLFEKLYKLVSIEEEKNPA